MSDIVPINVVVERNGRIKGHVAARITRLNPNGYVLGQKIRGWNPHPRISRISLDVIGPKEFIGRFGQQAYRNIPKAALFRQGHRKAIPMNWVMENMPSVTDTASGGWS